MPLPEKTRQVVVDYVLRDLAPVATAPDSPLRWFQNQFAFILDSNLRDRLGEAYYQARYMEKIREAFGLKHGFNHPFVHFQIVQYASIYEAVIDYKLDQVSHLPVVKSLMKYETFVEVSAFGQATRITYTDTAGSAHDVIACRIKPGTQKMAKVQFDKRLKTAVAIGLVPKVSEGFIKELYKNRNCLHLINASENDYAPLVEFSKNAFESMSGFLKHVKSWVPQNAAGVSPSPSGRGSG